MTMITDGTGRGTKAKVDHRNQLLTRTISETSYADAVRYGRAFNANANERSLSAISGEQAVFYIKNVGDQTIFLENLFGAFYNVNYSAATRDTSVWRVYQNPTGGTIVSDADTIIVPNRAAGSTRNFEENMVVYGASAGGKTLTGYTAENAYVTHAAGRLFVTLNLAVPAGQSFGITIDTFGATIGGYYVGFAGFLSDE